MAERNLLLDLSSRSGLKEVHARFEEIAATLDLAYVASTNARNYHSMGAVVSVWSEMCADVVLCKSLLAKS